MTDEPATIKKPSRRSRLSLRFSLKSMLLLVTAFGILCGCLWNFWWMPSQQQRQAVEQIDSRFGVGGTEHGFYRYESMDEFPFWKKKLGQWLGKDAVARVTFAYSEGTGEQIDISPWAGLKSVERVAFDHAIVDDLSVLRNFQKLKEFSVFQAGDPAPPGKVGLEVLGGCPSLETVKLHESTFTFNDEVFESICNARTIRKFEFASERLTNISPLKRLGHLEELYIFIYQRNNPLPDLNIIGSLPKLKILTLHLNNWLPDDFSFLENLQALESCQITGNLSEDHKTEIQNRVPANCKVTFK